MFAISDDGAFISQGESLIPFFPTDIELKKQFLSLNLKDMGKMNVYVEFEFLNSGDEKELTVGFITPPINLEEEADSLGNPNYRKPEIKNFRVFINDAEFGYSVNQLENLGFNSLKDFYNTKNYVYYFTAFFNKGKTVIKHTYTISENITGAGNLFEYVLSTGTYWANNEIEDFKLEINMGCDAAFEVPAFLESDGKLDYWEIEGIGKRKTVNDKFLNVYMKGGKLIYTKKNFIPDVELYIKYIYPLGYGNSIYDIDYDLYLIPEKELQKMSYEDLYILRNKFFALGGYKFKSNELYKYYDQFLWYWPEETITSENLFNTFPENIKTFIQSIKNLEIEKVSQRKKQISDKFKLQKF